MRRALGLVRDGPAALALLFVRHLPGRPGVALRYRYYRRRLGALGEGTRIDEGVHIVGGEHVFIGRGCWIAANAFLGAGPPSLDFRTAVRRANPDFRGREGELHIGDHVYVAPQVLINAHGGVAVEDDVAVSAGAKLYSSSHHYRRADGPRGVPVFASGMRRGRRDEQALLLAPVVVRAASFVGSNALVLPGVTMGPRTWLGAGGIARRRLEPDRVYRPAAAEVEPDGAQEAGAPAPAAEA